VQGSNFKKKKVKRAVEGIEVEGEVEHLHMDWYGDWPAAWDDVVGDYPRRFREGVTLNYGPLKGHKYPIKGFMIRTGNPVMTGGTKRQIRNVLRFNFPNYRFLQNCCKFYLCKKRCLAMYYS